MLPDNERDPCNLQHGGPRPHLSFMCSAGAVCNLALLGVLGTALSGAQQEGSRLTQPEVTSQGAHDMLWWTGVL